MVAAEKSDRANAANRQRTLGGQLRQGTVHRGHALAVDGGLMAARPHSELGRRMAEALESADDYPGWKTSIALPDGSSTRICCPPGPEMIALRKFAPASVIAATVAAMSST